MKTLLNCVLAVMALLLIAVAGVLCIVVGSMAYEFYDESRGLSVSVFVMTVVKAAVSVALAAAMLRWRFGLPLEQQGALAVLFLLFLVGSFVLAMMPGPVEGNFVLTAPLWLIIGVIVGRRLARAIRTRTAMERLQ